MADPTIESVRDWWRTGIIDIEPGIIRMRGYPIEQLIGRVGMADMIWLMLRGEMPQPAQSALLEAALVAAVDHGPQAPSIAIARMAASCGLDINNAMASAINTLGDVHGGAGQQCMELYEAVAERRRQGAPLAEAVAGEVALRLDAGQHVPGFGHRFHPVDPRAPRLLELVEAARRQGAANGRYAEIGRAVEGVLEARKGKRLPMNIDGVTAVVFCELGFPPTLGRGLFILSRSIGVLAHAWEQTCQGGRIKGPTPPAVGYRYEGPSPRTVPGADA